MSNLAEQNRDRHIDILMAVKGKGKTFRDVASEAECSPAMVTMVSKGQRKSRKVQGVLARVCERQIQDLFPGDDE
jgi:lambda repressor-like predicted transcriptional regulator